MTELLPKITIDNSQLVKHLHKKGNSHGSSMIDYSKFQLKEPLITQQYNTSIVHNLSMIQGSIHTENSKHLFVDDKSSRRLLNYKLSSSIDQRDQIIKKQVKERQSRTPKQGDQPSISSQIQITLDKDNLVSIKTFYLKNIKISIYQKIRIQKYYQQLKEQELQNEILNKKKSFICQKLLDSIEKECFQFQEVLNLLNKVLKRYLICSDNVLIDKLRKLETYFNQTICFDKDFFTYPQLLNRLNGQIEELQDQKYDSIQENQQIAEKKEKEYQVLEQKYSKLKDNFYLQLNSLISQQKQKIEDVEKQNEILKAEKEKYTEQLTKIHENYDKVFYEKYSNYDQTLNEYKAIEKKFEMQNKDYNELKCQYNEIYETYKKNTIDLKMFKDKNALNENKISLLQAEINSLKADNTIYKETYTPRPNLIEVLEMNNIEYDKEKKNTTKQLVSIIENSLLNSQTPLNNITNKIKVQLNSLVSHISPISPVRQQGVHQQIDRKKVNNINQNYHDPCEQNLTPFTTNKNLSKRLSPTNFRTRINQQLMRGQRDVQKTDISNTSGIDMRKQKRKTVLDLQENQTDIYKIQQGLEKKKTVGNIQDTLQKESKTIQIGDQIKKRAKSTHQKDAYLQNQSTLDIFNDNIESSQTMNQYMDNTEDRTFEEFAKRRRNKDVQNDSKYNVKISYSQDHIDEEIQLKYQEDISERESFDNSSLVNNSINRMKPKDKFLYYIQKRNRKLQ